MQTGRSDLFEVVSAKVTGLDTYALRHMFYEPDGKALVTVCRAINIPRKQFVELYLLGLRSRAASGSASPSERTAPRADPSNPTAPSPRPASRTPVRLF